MPGHFFIGDSASPRKISEGQGHQRIQQGGRVLAYIHKRQKLNRAFFCTAQGEGSP